MSKTERIEIEPLARVEGHGGIRVEIKDNKVQNVEVRILEGPRLFETLVLGKTPEEDLSIVPRICAICNLSHKFAALRGLEKALGVTVPEATQLYRELMHHGEMLESHSLHLYFLALPDFLGYDNAIAMAEKYGDVVTKALALKKFANKVMRIMGGRMIHGENPILGGFGRLPDHRTLQQLREEAEGFLPFAMETIDLLASLEVPDYMERETRFLCLKPPHDGYGYYGDILLASDGKEYDVEDYKSVISERVVGHSFAKRGRYQDRPFTVGAIARVLNLGDRLTGKAREARDRLVNERWYRNPLYNNFAQAVEMVFSLEDMVRVIDRLLELDQPEIARPTRETGVGTGGVEAPRGILLHHYEIENGLTVSADIITPTAMFLDDVEAFIRRASESLLSKNELDNFELRLEMVARAFDPCISCSTHLVTVEFE